MVPLRRAGGDDERARRDDVRFETAELAFDAYADVAPAGEGSHGVVGIGQSQPRLVRLADVRPVDDRALPNFVGNIARLINCADGNDVLGGSGRLDGVRVAARAVFGAIASVASAEHKEDRLGTGDFRQRIADGSIVARGGEVIGVVIRVMPTVVGNEGVRASGSFLEVGVGGRPRIGIRRDGEDLRRGGLAAELQADGGHN